MSRAPYFLGPLSLVGAVCSLAAVARAEAPAPEGAIATADAVTAHLREASECAHLFGTPHSRGTNKEHREGKIHWVEEEKTGITLAHSHGVWGYPIHLLPRGITIIAIRQMDKDTAKVVIRLHQALAQRLACPAGEYLLQMDDSIGGQMQILAVLKNHILVSYGEQLGYLSLPAVKPPSWLMAWRPHGIIHSSQGPATAQNVIKPSISPKARKIPDRHKRAPRPVDIKR